MWHGINGSVWHRKYHYVPCHCLGELHEITECENSVTNFSMLNGYHHGSDYPVTCAGLGQSLLMSWMWKEGSSKLDSVWPQTTKYEQKVDLTHWCPRNSCHLERHIDLVYLNYWDWKLSSLPVKSAANQNPR